MGKTKTNWEYRLFKRMWNHKYLHEPQTLYEIREVYYNNDGSIKEISLNPDIICRSVEEMRDTLQLMTESLEKEIVGYEEAVKEHPHQVDR